MKFFTTRLLSSSSHSYPVSQQIPHQTPATCAFFLSLEPFQPFSFLIAFPFAICFDQTALSTVCVFLPSWPLCLFQYQFKSFFVKETFPENQVWVSPFVFFFIPPCLSPYYFQQVVIICLFLKTSVSSKRIGSTSALFKTKCCKIGTVSGHKMGLIIIFYMNEASQWKASFTCCLFFT